MVVIHQLCENYGWDFDTAIKRTMPQVIMLNHAAWVSKERMDKRMDADRKNKKNEENSPTVNGKTFDQMTTDEQLAYYGSNQDSGWDFS